MSGQLHVHKVRISISVRTYVREWAAVITVMALIASASEHFKHFWLSATSSGGACVTNTRVQFCDELVHLKYFELLQPWRRQHPVKFLFLFFLEGALSLLLTFFLSLLSASAFSHAEKPADEKRTQNTSVHVTQRTHARLTKAQTHGCCKCRHTKPFLLNTSNAVNPFNRFSVAMATCCRLTEQDVTKKKKPFFLGDRWRHPETSDGSGACVCICVQKVNELMCQRVKYLITSTNDETGRKWGAGLFLCDWHYSLFCEKQPTHMHVHAISGTVYPCYPSTPTASPPQWLWPSLSYHWLVRAASCFFCISVDERMRVRERQSHEPVPSVFFSPMFLPTRCLPPTLSQQRWNFSASSLARFLVLSSCSLPVTLPSTICTFCFSHTLCLSFLNSTFFILTFFSLFNSVLHPTLTLFFWYRAH